MKTSENDNTFDNTDTLLDLQHQHPCEQPTNSFKFRHILLYFLYTLHLRSAAKCIGMASAPIGLVI